MNKQSPGFGRIVQVDYPALISLLAPLVTSAVYVGNQTFDFMPERSRFFFWLATAAIVAGVPTLVWRLTLIRAVFERGVESIGVITSVRFYKDRGRVEFAYSVQEQRYESGNALNRTARTRELQEGHRVRLIVDPQNPRRAFLRDLYLD